MKNTILKFAFSTMLAVLLATMTATAQKELCTYLDEYGKEQQHTATVLDYASDFGVNPTPTLGKSDQETWYIVKGSISLDKRLDICGDVHLILADNAKLSVNYYVTYGCHIFGSLTLYSQSYGDHMGKLTLEESGGFRTNNALTINGGFVTAQSYSSFIDGDFTFNGGKLVANKVYGNATIGYNSPNDYVQIKEVDKGSVTIKDGQRFVTNGSDIAEGTISASDFYSKFGDKKLTPYGGYKVTINNTHVFYVLPNGTIDASTIGYTLSDVKYANGNDFDISTPVTTDLNLTANLTPIEYSITYVLGDNATNGNGNLAKYTVETEPFTLSEPSRDNCEFLGWTYEGQTEPTKNVKIAKGSMGNKTFNAVWTVNDVPYLDAEGKPQTATATEFTNMLPTTLGKSDQETWYIVKGSISLNKTLDIRGNVHLILADNAELSVNYSFIYGSLTLYSQSYGDNMGKMIASYFHTNNALTINGGFVTEQSNNGYYYIDGDFTFNGGKLVANTGVVYGNATIGYNSPNDYVKIKQVDNGSVTIKDGRFFIAEGGDIAKGTISASDFNSKFGGKKLSFPYYIYISSVENLKALAKYVNEEGGFTEGMTFILTADIDFKPQEGDDNNFDPIGSDHPFKGTFDGGGHTIKGLRVDRSGYNSGLFGYNSGTVRNVILDGAKIKGMSNTGGIVGGNKGTIENCTVSNSSIDPQNRYCCGGIAGTNYGTLSNNLVINTTVAYAAPDGAIVGDNNKDDGNTPILSNNFYYNCAVNGNSTNVGCFGKDITENNGAVHVDYIIDGDSEQSLSIESGEYSKVVYRRNFTDGITTTIMLPFVFKASDFSGEKFYYFDGIDTETWTATMASDNQTENLSANTPYIFTPSPETAAQKYFVFNGVKIESPTAGYTEVTPWKFQGTYKYQSWNTNGNREIKNIYGFAATSSTNTEGDYIAAGKFVRAGLKARIRPTRAYLEYNGTEGYLLSKSAIELPDRIKVVFIDKETSSVIDDPAINPSDPNGDIPTPTSELNPAANVKVWSYDKTIYIASRPGTDYRIIDVNGRLLKQSTTQTDRDEVRLGSRSGIVVVIIGNKAYKLNY